MAEREWREGSDLRPSAAGLALVVVAGLLLRFWGLGHGLPDTPSADERDTMTNVVRMMNTGDFNPRTLEQPGLHSHLQLILASVRFLAGAAAGRWSALDEVGPADFYLSGRMLSAVLGVATILLVHAAGMRWGSRHALLAAGLMAVMPLHVRDAHFAVASVPLTFFVVLAFVLSLRAHEAGAARTFALAGAVAGLATATFLDGAIALGLPLLAASMTLDGVPSRRACVLAAVGGWAGAFLLAAPYTILDLPGFLDGFARLAAEHRAAEGRGWLAAWRGLHESLGWPALILAGAGWILSVVRLARGPGRVRWTLLVSFPVAGLWLATAGLTDARRLLPVLPFACILSAIAVISGVSLLRRFSIPRAPRTALIAGLTVIALLPPAIGAVRSVRALVRPPGIEPISVPESRERSRPGHPDTGEERLPAL